MFTRAAADAIVLLHLGFIVFVVLGGLLVFRWTWIAGLHVPALVWGAFIEFFGGVCPLTPLEQSLRIAAGDQGYSGGFIEHYIVAAIYPAGLTPSTQMSLGIFVIVINAAIYAALLYRRRRGRI
jgi:hypothetical protein